MNKVLVASVIGIDSKKRIMMIGAGSSNAFGKDAENDPQRSEQTRLTAARRRSGLVQRPNSASASSRLNASQYR